MQQSHDRVVEEVVQLPDEVKEKWQRLANSLSMIAHVPVALIMRVDKEDIEVLVASSGKDNPYTPGDREHLFNSGLYCEAVVANNHELHVPDAYSDDKWCNNPDLEFGLSAYLGYPICLPNGEVFGTLCILDRQANEFSPDIHELMLTYKKLIEVHLRNIMLRQDLRTTLN